MFKNEKGFTAIEILSLAWFLLVALVMMLGIVGWSMNIYKLTKCDFESPYKSEIIRGAGVAIPVIGAITGYVDIKDKK